jgi:hypothetical protein
VEGHSAFRVTNENIGATTLVYSSFSICAQVQTGPEFFALVESIRGD